jgi:hypothetical protein
MPDIVTVTVGDTPEDANWILSPQRRAEEIAILKAVAAERRVKAMKESAGQEVPAPGKSEA